MAEPSQPSEGLGNYKGVMLCNRPGQGGSGQKVEQPPFVPTQHHEDASYQPVRHLELDPDVKRGEKGKKAAKSKQQREIEMKNIKW